MFVRLLQTEFRCSFSQTEKTEFTNISNKTAKVLVTDLSNSTQHCDRYVYK